MGHWWRKFGTYHPPDLNFTLFGDQIVFGGRRYQILAPAGTFCIEWPGGKMRAA